MSIKDCTNCVHRRGCYEYVCCYWALHYPRPNTENCNNYIYENRGEK